MLEAIAVIGASLGSGASPATEPTVLQYFPQTRDTLLPSSLASVRILFLQHYISKELTSYYHLFCLVNTVLPAKWRPIHALARGATLFRFCDRSSHRWSTPFCRLFGHVRACRARCIHGPVGCSAGSEILRFGTQRSAEIAAPIGSERCEFARASLERG